MCGGAIWSRGGAPQERRRVDDRLEDVGADHSPVLVGEAALSLPALICSGGRENRENAPQREEAEACTRAEEQPWAAHVPSGEAGGLMRGYRLEGVRFSCCGTPPTVASNRLVPLGGDAEAIEQESEPPAMREATCLSPPRPSPSRRPS